MKVNAASAAAQNTTTAAATATAATHPQDPSQCTKDSPQPQQQQLPPPPPLTTLWVEGFHIDDNEKEIRELFHEFLPIVSVERPHDNQGNPRSHVFLTLLSQHAEKVIETMNGKWVLNDWTLLTVEFAKNQERKRRRVATAVVKNGGRKRVCRAYCHGQCLTKCPFGLDHRFR